MRRTESFRLQHADLTRQAEALAAFLHDEASLRAGADDVRAQLHRLTQSLTHHAAHEDDRLYPTLFQHRDERLRETARALHGDFGVVYAAVEVFLSVWMRPRAIEEDTAHFVAAAREVLTTLAARIRREEDELYALIDALP